MKAYNNASNLNTIKSNNRSLILRVLNSLGQVSRAELSRITGLTKTSITNIVGELIDAGIVYETGTVDSSNGRKPILLNLAKDSLYSLGVYISRDFAYTNVANLKGEIVKEKKHFFELTENSETFISIISQGIRSVLSESGVEGRRLLGIGIASIGPLDIAKGVILDPPNFRGLKSIPIVDALKEAFNLNVYLENDMNAGAIAEKLFGSAKNISNFIYMGVTNGIGAGIVINDRIFRGSNGFAGEIGHTTVDIHGDRCSCGNLGCLEMYANIPGTVSRIRESIALGAGSALSKEADITWEKVISAAQNGDSLCLKAIDRLIHNLSIGLVNAINTFDPEIVFLGHELALAGEMVTKPLNEIVNMNILFRSSKQVSIELSQFRDYAPCIGAPAIVLNEFFTASGTVFTPAI